MAQVDDGVDDAGITFIAGQTAHKTAVYLQATNRKTFEVTQAGVTGAKVVDGQLHAQGRELTQTLQGFFRVLNQDGLG